MIERESLYQCEILRDSRYANDSEIIATPLRKSRTTKCISRPLSQVYSLTLYQSSSRAKRRLNGCDSTLGLCTSASRYIIARFCLNDSEILSRQARASKRARLAVSFLSSSSLSLSLWLTPASAYSLSIALASSLPLLQLVRAVFVSLER